MQDIKRIFCFQHIKVGIFIVVYCIFWVAYITEGFYNKLLVFFPVLGIWLVWENQKYRKIILVILLSGGVFFALGEVYFRAYYFGADSIWNFTKYVPAPMGDPLCYLQYDPQSYTGLKAKSSGIFKGKPFCVNNFGFRDRDWEVKKEKGVIRIAICGASISMGSGVSIEESYARKLEKLIKEQYKQQKLEFLNFSKPGYNITDIIRLLEKMVLSFDPDIIVVEDMKQLWFKKKSSFVRKLDKTLTKSAWMALLQRPWDVSFFIQAVERKISPNIHRFMEGIGIKGLITRNRPGADGPLQDYLPMDQAKVHLQEIHDLTIGKKIFFIDIRADKSSRENGESQYYHFLKEEGHRYGFEFIDRLQIYGSHDYRQLIIYPGDVHPNALGHTVISRKIFDIIQPAVKEKISSLKH